MKKVCDCCFIDDEIRGFIETRSIEVGNCDFCGSKEKRIINIDELYDFFQELVSSFQRTNDKGGTPLVSLIQNNWSLFYDHSIANKILDSILPKLNTQIYKANQQVDFNPDILENVNYWDILKKSLKWKNRYITDINYLIEDLGWDRLLSNISTINKEEKYYRARLHPDEGKAPYNKTEMFCPPPEKSTAGRANPKGIPFLYLCDNKNTVLYEIRATYLDELSIGTFSLKSSIKDHIAIADFTSRSSVFYQGDNMKSEISNRIKSRLLMDKISRDLSKPIRRYDSDLDYIPTQFICEFIRIFSGVHGIKFKSSLYDKGNNVVLFDQEIMECVSIEKVHVKRVSISTNSM